MSDLLYLLTMCGVYDQGPCGIFTTREDAEAHAAELWQQSDGYHDFRIDEIPIDKPLTPHGLSVRVGAATHAARERRNLRPVGFVSHR